MKQHTNKETNFNTLFDFFMIIWQKHRV